MSNPDQGGQQNQGGRQDQRAWSATRTKARTGWPAAGRSEARTAGAAKVIAIRIDEPQCSHTAAHHFAATALPPKADVDWPLRHVR